MSQYLNDSGVPLSVAVYLAHDSYDFVPGVMSATSIMKSVKKQILPGRIPKDQRNSIPDVLSVVKSRIGTSIHDGLEKAWSGKHYKDAMRDLGYPQSVIDRVVVNPEGPIAKDAIPVYMEIRSFREIDGKRVSGKFDFAAEGRVEDFKSTSTYTWVKGVKDEDYQIQGSIYRWLNPDIITQDHMAIQFFFTDWKLGMAQANPKYPQRIVEQKLIPLLSLTDTEQYIRGKLNLFEQYKGAPESEMPPCTDKDLWRSDPAFKYYKNPDPAKRSRSTKNFDTLAEANARLLTDGNVGVVVTVPGRVMACNYCSAAPICAQRQVYIEDGTLTPQ